MNWTKEQQRAIDIRNKSILVSAAAGSGKTAVLVERIKKLILEEDCALDRMLIVTFTNKAASEMKEKIEKEIKNTISKSQNRDEIKKLKRQLDLMPKANISTFHSFCLNVIKRWFFLINMEPNLKMCDPTKQVLLRRKAMDSLLEELFSENSPEFYDFLDKFGNERNNEAFKDIINNVYNTLQSIENPYIWLERAVENLNDFDNQEVQKEILECVYASALYLINKTIKYGESIWEYGKQGSMTKALEPVEERLNLLKIIRNAVENKDFKNIISEVETAKPENLSKKYFKEENNSSARIPLEDYYEKASLFKEEFKNTVDKLKDILFFESWEEMVNDTKATYQSGKFLLNCIKKYERLYGEEKNKKGLLDFDDIMHKACEILDHEEAANYYKEKFDYIFIDEYQDSNIIQEALIAKIARSDNLFMVGDIKQSIYKFRLAEPEIFQKRYEDFAAHMKTHGKASIYEKIDLNKNFRSKREIIDFVNNVFNDIMPDYDENAKLYLGDPNGNKNPYKPIIFMANKNWEENEEIDEEIANLKETEKEALMIAKIIKENLNKPIFDSKAGIERPLKLKDIVVLVRSVKSHGEILYNILGKHNISVFLDDTEGYFDTMEINTFLSLLNIIDNEKQDIHLLTVMRSFIFKFTVEELALIRLKNKKASYHDCLKEYSVDGENEALKVKCQNLQTKILQWRELKKILPLEEFVWKLMLETQFYLLVGAMPNGRQRQGNLRSLIDMARTYSEGESVSLYGFIRYIDAVKEGKVNIGQTKLITEKDDVVRIMTIHKSKGLEFPMVIIAGYGRKLKYSSGEKKIILDKDMGISLPLVNYEDGWIRPTILGNLIRLKKQMGEVDEEKRVLYVAMTRAQDILYMTATCKEVLNPEDMNINAEYDEKTYLNMTLPSLNRADIEVMDDGLLRDLAAGKESVKISNRELDYEENPCTDKEIKRLMEYKYPAQGDFLLKSKYSVSELNREENPQYMKQALRLREPESFNSHKELSKAEVGVVTHKVLELLDFSKAGGEEGSKYVKNLLDRMVEEYFLTAMESEAVDIQAVVDFARSDLGGRIAEAHAQGKLYREQPFVIKRLKEGAEIMVQGIIDCFFMEGENIVLVDYKTSNMTKDKFMSGGKEEIAKNYKKQMEIYKEAIELSYGKKVDESYLYLTNLSEAVKMS